MCLLWVGAVHSFGNLSEHSWLPVLVKPALLWMPRSGECGSALKLENLRNCAKGTRERKRHINTTLFCRWPSGRGESPGRVSRGLMCYLRNPKNINLFVLVPDREDRWPGWPDRVLCAKVLCAFSAPSEQQPENRDPPFWRVSARGDVL